MRNQVGQRAFLLMISLVMPFSTGFPACSLSMCRIHSRSCINKWRIPTLAVSNVCGQGCANLHFQEMAVPFYVRHKSIYFGGGGGAPGFLTPVVSYAPRPISR